MKLDDARFRVEVDKCPQCNGRHGELLFVPVTPEDPRAVTHTHRANCPKSNGPIYVRMEQQAANAPNRGISTVAQVLLRFDGPPR